MWGPVLITSIRNKKADKEKTASGRGAGRTFEWRCQERPFCSEVCRDPNEGEPCGEFGGEGTANTKVLGWQ